MFCLPERTLALTTCTFGAAASRACAMRANVWSSSTVTTRPARSARATTVTRASLCGLGQTAPNPVLSTLRYFRDEYEAHLEGRCPAGRCRSLITYSITDDCIGCTKCAQACPADAIPMTPYQQHKIDTEKCIRCDTCRQLCPVDAVVVE